MCKRCSWLNPPDPIYIEYHDHEWGIPVYDDQKLFEMLILEGFQAGLSWITILRKRSAFQKAFDHFDVKKVAGYDEQKIQQLLNNSSIIRNQRKIRGSIVNAQIFMKIQNEYGSFSNYIWHFTNHQVIYNENDRIPTHTDLSDKISNDLKKRGMKFVGTVIIYSYLQAIGVVNDHELGCDLYHVNRLENK